MKKIADIIDFIERNLEADLTVESIAAACGYSSYHFQRLFAQCVGVTVGFYMTQRRMMKAALALHETDARIIEIAQMSGYDSQEAFTRAFKKHFAKTPAHYRKERCVPVLRAFPAFTKEMVSHLGRHKELANPRFADKETRAFAGLSTTLVREGPPSTTQDVWREVNRRSCESHRPCASYGLLLNGATHDDGACYNSFRYAATFEVERQASVPEGMEYFEIERQHYAIFDHRGGMRTLPLANRYIWGVWLAQNNRRVAASPDIEAYPATFTARKDERMEIWIPVERC